MGLYDDLKKAGTATPKTLAASRVLGVTAAIPDAISTGNYLAQGDYNNAAFSGINTAADIGLTNPVTALPSAALRTGTALGEYLIPKAADAYYDTGIASRNTKDELYNMYKNAATPSEMRAIYQKRLADQQAQEAQARQLLEQQQAQRQAQQDAIANARTIPGYLASALAPAQTAQSVFNDPQLLATQDRVINAANEVGGGGGLLMAAAGTANLRNSALLNSRMIEKQNQTNLNSAMQRFAAEQNANALANSMASSYDTNELTKQYLTAKESGDVNRAQNILDVISLKQGKVPAQDYKTVNVKDSKGLETTQILNQNTGQLQTIKAQPIMNPDNTVTLPGIATPMPRAEFERRRRQLGY